MQVTANNYYMEAYQKSLNVQKTTSSLSISGSYLEITGGLSTINTTDGVDLSEKAKELSNRIKELDIFKIIYPDNDPRKDVKSLKDVENDFNADFMNFAGAFGKMSGMMGMNSSDMFTMGLDGVGGMTVAGTSESMAANLQAAFNGNSGGTSVMVSRFAVMAARAALVDAGNTVDGFQDSYSQDPFAAITDNIDALKERLLGFRVEAGGGSMNYGFIRSFNAQIDYSSTSVSYTSAETEAKAEAEEAAATV